MNNAKSLKATLLKIIRHQWNDNISRQGWDFFFNVFLVLVIAWGRLTNEMKTASIWANKHLIILPSML